MRKKKPPRVDLDTYLRTGDYPANRMLFEWLCDDDRRARLFREVSDAGLLGLSAPSRAVREHKEDDDEASRKLETTLHKRLLVLTNRKRIERILGDKGLKYSNDPYAKLGGGAFMLALDPEKEKHHANQRDIAREVFAISAQEIKDLCALARRSAAVLSLRKNTFDLAEFAEQAALRFCSDLFGFALKDFLLLEPAMRRAYRALNYQILARHFVTEPLLLRESKASMAALLRRTALLIDEYQLGRDDWPEDVVALEGTLASFEPVLKRLAKLGKDYEEVNGEQRAVIAVGTLAGIVGNVQSCVCIAVRAFFENAGVMQALRDDLRKTKWSDDALQPYIYEALRLNAPVPFVPRRAVVADDELCVKPGDDILLALGAATLSNGGHTFQLPPPSGAHADPLIFGGEPKTTHGCLGKYLAQPLILELVRHVLSLPGLEEELDPLDGKVIGLEKSWAYKCERYPLRYRSDKVRRQQTLNVSMRIKSPFRDNADQLRMIIRAGAPRIDRLLREARHVHFAWFEFIENDKRLVLHTVYDGDFNAYIQHFALAAGDLFDQLFEHIEDAPPKPVAQFPNEFIDLIRRYNQAPALGYTFSAYPEFETAQVTRAARREP